MSLDQHCREGHLEDSEFVQLVAHQTPVGTEHLARGDYLIAPEMFRSGFRAERIVQLGIGAEHDFRTVRGTTGPIEGNVYIKLPKPGQVSTPILIRGDRAHGAEPGSVDYALNIRYMYEAMMPTKPK